ncbi:hypothetical protein GK047_21385 [Paenibacillus sp. SYP-B3998]|uniref:DUF2140 family protein n=1 Tax=Paenibacillus sp. SYP-B3998 TaxID=2678564 RepID=A0A6G4A238_9BACL|nr:hypothetical protein [Paenibacillus sp. SYP-B3998]NEW08556.1 hypothetical protein [Paenibacillus sp. SYP-B3998]
MTIVLLIVVLAGGLWYIKPTEVLDLNYKELEITNKILDIIKNRKLEVVLTEQDVNNMVKKQLAARQTLPNDVRIEGAKISVHGTMLEADVNIRWHDQVPVGAKMWFNLTWNNPNLQIEHVATQIKGFKLPNAWLQLAPFQIPIEQHLPKLIGVKTVVFEDRAIQIDLKLLK